MYFNKIVLFDIQYYQIRNCYYDLEYLFIFS